MSNFTVEFLSAGVSACAAPTKENQQINTRFLLMLYFFLNLLRCYCLACCAMAIFSLVARGRVLSGGSSQPSSPLGSTASSDVTVRIDDAVSVGSGIFSDNEDVDGADMMAFSADEDVDEAGATAAAAIAAVTADIDVADVAIGDIANRTAVSGMDFLPGMVRSDRPMGAATSIAPRGDGTDREGSVPSVGHANPTAGAATNFLSTVVVLTPQMGAGLRIPLRSRALGAYGARDVAAGFDANRPAGSAMDFLPMSMGPIQPIRGRLRTASESSVGDQELEADSAADSEAGAAAAQACEGALEAGEQGIQVGESTNHGMLYSTYYDDLCAQGDEDDEDLDAFEDAVAYDTPAHAPAALSPARAAVVAPVPAVAEVRIPVLECSRAETRRSPAQIFFRFGLRPYGGRGRRRRHRRGFRRKSCRHCLSRAGPPRSRAPGFQL